MGGWPGPLWDGDQLVQRGVANGATVPGLHDVDRGRAGEVLHRLGPARGVLLIRNLEVARPDLGVRKRPSAWICGDCRRRLLDGRDAGDGDLRQPGGVVRADRPGDTGDGGNDQHLAVSRRHDDARLLSAGPRELELGLAALDDAVPLVLHHQIAEARHVLAGVAVVERQDDLAGVADARLRFLGGVAPEAGRRLARQSVGQQRCRPRLLDGLEPRRQVILLDDYLGRR